MLGHDIAPVIATDTAVREAAMWGQFGAQVNVTDGRYVYMRSPIEGADGPPMFTLSCGDMRAPNRRAQLQKAQLHPGFGFTKGCSVLQIPRGHARFAARFDEPQLYDLRADSTQQRPLNDPAIEAKMVQHLSRLMSECEAPLQQFARLGLNA